MLDYYKLHELICIFRIYIYMLHSIYQMFVSKIMGIQLNTNTHRPTTYQVEGYMKNVTRVQVAIDVYSEP
jgi:hypothetical protein